MVVGHGSWVVGRGSWVVGRGYQDVGRGSWVSIMNYMYRYFILLSWLARGVDHHRASRVRNTNDRGVRERPKQIWRRVAFFAQGHFCTVGDEIRI